MSQWYKTAEDGLMPKPTMPPAAPLAPKPLSELSQERPERVNPTGNPEPPQPLSLKEVSDALEAATKAMLDAGLNFEKAKVALDKIKAMHSQTAKDRSIVSKCDGFTEGISRMKSECETQSKSMGDYRDELASPAGGAPKSPWLA